MQNPQTQKSFDKTLMDSMKSSFSDVHSINKGFVYFSERPAIQGTFSFTVRKTPMMGGYMILLVKEQSSLYSFSWSGEKKFFDEWNIASEKAIASLKTTK